MRNSDHSKQLLSSSELVAVLKAAAEPTRLRILVLLRSGELNVKDLMQILRQSQPRLSRHLKLLHEAGLLERFREGSWVYFRLAEDARFGDLASGLTQVVDSDDPLIARDRERLEALKRDREQAAQAYFEAHAGEWDRIRALHVAEGECRSSDAGGSVRPSAEHACGSWYRYRTHAGSSSPTGMSGPSASMSINQCWHTHGRSYHRPVTTGRR